MQKSTIALLLFFLHSHLFAQTKAPLGIQEIKAAKQVQFQNKSNRKAPANVIRENTETGRTLAQAIRENPNATQEFRGIQIQRILPPKDSQKMGADILRISPDQNFDHINSINRILSAYIENSFQYTEENADILATFVLYYNAAHRQEINFIQTRYIDPVVESLDPQKIGIDINYRNWPGKTEILIPIAGNILKQGGQDITTDELEEEVGKLVKAEKDPETKKKMEQETQKMRELQDRKLQEEKKQVRERQEELSKKEQDLNRKQQETERKIQETGRILQDLRKDPVKNAALISEKEKQITQLETEKAKIEEEKKQVAETKPELEKKEQELAKKEEKRDESKKDESQSASASTQQQLGGKDEKKPEEKVEELKRELAAVREELKKKEEKSENVIDNKIFFMKFIKYDSDGHYSNELWAIDPVKDDALFKSPFTNICSKEFIEIPNQGILVLGYEGNKVSDRKHKLTYLDVKTLKLKKQSDVSDVFWRTPMVYTDEKIYVIEKFENKYHLSRFNPDLSVDVRSSDPVEENSEITFFKDKIYITGKGKQEGNTVIKIFNRKDLKLLKILNP